MPTNLDRNAAVETFMKILIAHARNGIIGDIMSTLERGPSVPRTMKDKVVWHQWFQGLGDEDKEYVYQIIRETVDAALFSTLVILDGAAGRPIPGKLSDFALYLQEYDDEDAERSDLPKFRVRLNSVNATEDLHDIFKWSLKEYNQ